MAQLHAIGTHLGATQLLEKRFSFDSFLVGASQDHPFFLSFASRSMYAVISPYFGL